MTADQLPPARPPSPSGEARALLAGLRRRGVEVRLEGGSVKWRCRSGRMSWSLVAAVKEHEPELVRLLAAEGAES